MNGLEEITKVESFELTQEIIESFNSKNSEIQIYEGFPNGTYTIIEKKNVEDLLSSLNIEQIIGDDEYYYKETTEYEEGSEEYYEGLYEHVLGNYEGGHCDEYVFGVISDTMSEKLKEWIREEFKIWLKENIVG